MRDYNKLNRCLTSKTRKEEKTGRENFKRQLTAMATYRKTTAYKIVPMQHGFKLAPQIQEEPDAE